MPSVTNRFPRFLATELFTETQTHYTRQGGAERLTKMETSARPQLVRLNGSVGPIDLGVGRLDSESKELRPSVTANHPHKASV